MYLELNLSSRGSEGETQPTNKSKKIFEVKSPKKRYNRNSSVCVHLVAYD